ncbi:MAG: sulfatase [bacterium]|nr:sulfatase [bacterium]
MKNNLSRREFLRASAAAGAALVAGQLSGPAAWAAPVKPAAKRPNLLFVMSDEHAYDMLGCYGNSQIRTPSIDKCAAEGIRFNYCVSSYPVCTPYRGILLSGLHPLHNAAIINDIQMLSSDVATGGKGKYFGEVLRDAGYHMGYVGKWHLFGGDRDRGVPNGPYRYGFNEYFLTNNCHVDYRPGKCFYFDENGQKVFFKEWEVYGQTRQALEFLDKAPDDKPFALFVSWHPPHDMGMDRETRRFKYRSGAPEEMLPLYDPEKLHYRPGTVDSDWAREYYQGYMAMVSGVDKAFGWLMNKLKEKGLDQNTLVVFTADHGDMLGSHEAPGPKPYPEDYSTRVPFIMRWPARLPAGADTDLLLGSLDLMPTILGLMDLPVPETCEGKNLTQPILDKRDDAVDSIPLFTLWGYRGVYTRQYTYTTGVTDAEYMAKHYNRLYDRKNDPHELKNLYGDPVHKELQDRLHVLTLEWMKKLGDEGWTREQLWSICSDKPQIGAHLGGPGETGKLKGEGRPVDILKAKGIKGTIA